MLSAENMIYHATTRKQYSQKYNADTGRYQISPQTEGREERNDFITFASSLDNNTNEKFFYKLSSDRI